MKKTFTTRLAEGLPLLNFRLDATSAQVHVSTAPNLAEATVTISGPQEIVDGATEQRGRTSWFIRLPEEPSTTVVTHTRGGTVMSANVVSGGTVIMGGNMTVINGVVVSGNQTVTVEPTVVTVLLPEGSDLRTVLSNGSVDARGSYTEVTHDASNASLSVEAARRVEADTSNGKVTVGRATDTIDVRTSNGKVRVDGSAPRTDVRTSNGSITIQAAGSHQINARASNGNVTVYRNGHQADIRTRTSNGRDRVL